ncbi:hypothetical protein ASPCAL07935 [Aspergillus calidoustus]|uniref:Uncharacterized protein n=1 Tax=Aspergillus calidoustus TaxID=454130 RepID=A0A0U4ZZ72_ASPCI|nr:hypothetical protein ASPCAL07935 [Aspergillus calidoustus]
MDSDRHSSQTNLEKYASAIHINSVSYYSPSLTTHPGATKLKPLLLLRCTMSRGPLLGPKIGCKSFSRHALVGSWEIDIELSCNVHSPGAPILSVKLSTDGPEPIELRNVDPSSYHGHRVDVNVTVTYHGVNENGNERLEEAPPIIFHTYAITDPTVAMSCYRQRNDNEWEEVESEEGCLGYVDFPNQRVHVGDHEDFVSLKAGESWTTVYAVADISYAFPTDVVSGDQFRFRFDGCRLDWWDWGSVEDHVDTVVSLPSFGTYVCDPRDNGGRPEVVIPASNDIHFTYVA